MGCISKNTLRRLILLYFVGKYKNGVYGSTRFQKVLYYAEKEMAIRPFPYRHTDHGQYSAEAQNMLKELEAMGYIIAEDLESELHEGVKWRLANRESFDRFATILRRAAPEIVDNIDASIKQYGYMRDPELYEFAHYDPLLEVVQHGEVIFEENLPETIDIHLSDEQCDDLELTLNPEFVSGMARILDGIENHHFDITKVAPSGFLQTPGT